MSTRRIEGILFDLDETLYPKRTGLMQAIGQRIHRYMIQRLGMNPEVAFNLRKEYYRRYGTSLRGLQIHYGIDPEDYLAFVHDVLIADYIHPNPALRTMLEQINHRKIIFTNATAEHASNVTRVLGVEHLFEQVIDVRSNNFIGKPHQAAYQRALELTGIPPEVCLLVEDNVRNLRPAKRLGMLTALVDEPVTAEDLDGDVDFNLTDVLDVQQIISGF
jgi:putative hydrolase of the HAD superfamily